MLFAPVLAVLMLTGCLSRPALDRQTFAFGWPETPSTNAPGRDGVLGIRKITVASPFESRSLVYRTGEDAYVRDPYAEFLDSPEEGLMTPLRVRLGSQGDFKTVLEPGSGVRPGMWVEINVGQLYGDFRQRTRPQAVLTMRFIFFSATTNFPSKPFFQREYSRDIVLGAPTAPELMKGWNQALDEITAEALSDLRGSKAGETNTN